MTIAPGAGGGVQLGIAAFSVVLSLWAAAHLTVFLTIPVVVLAAVLGNWAGANTGRALAEQYARTRRIVLYSEDTPLYALVLPLASAAMSPGVILWGLVSNWNAPWFQTLMPLMLCLFSVTWISHDLSLARNLWLLNERVGQVPIQWFHARSVVGQEGTIGQRAVVLLDCAPDGYVRLQGERWRARSWDGAPIRAGQTVEVQHVDGLMLVVAPAVEEPEESR